MSYSDTTGLGSFLNGYLQSRQQREQKDARERRTQSQLDYQNKELNMRQAQIDKANQQADLYNKKATYDNAIQNILQNNDINAFMEFVQKNPSPYGYSLDDVYKQYGVHLDPQTGQYVYGPVDIGNQASQYRSPRDIAMSYLSYTPFTNNQYQGSVNMPPIPSQSYNSTESQDPPPLVPMAPGYGPQGYNQNSSTNNQMPMVGMPRTAMPSMPTPGSGGMMSPGQPQGFGYAGCYGPDQRLPFQQTMIGFDKNIYQLKQKLRGLIPGSQIYNMVAGQIDDYNAQKAEAFQYMQYGKALTNQALESYKNGEMNPTDFYNKVRTIEAQYGVSDDDVSNPSRERDFGFNAQKLAGLKQAIARGDTEYAGQSISSYLGPDGRIARTSAMPISQDVSDQRFKRAVATNPLYSKYKAKIDLTDAELRLLHKQMKAQYPGRLSMQAMDPKTYWDINQKLYLKDFKQSRQKKAGTQQLQLSNRNAPIGKPGASVQKGTYVPPAQPLPSQKGQIPPMKVSPPPVISRLPYRGPVGIDKSKMRLLPLKVPPGVSVPDYSNIEYLNYP